jgi:hypothetical protein
MADFYVRSTDGNNSDNGSTWALAKATLAGAFAVCAAGDTIFVSKSHSESTGSFLTLISPGTFAAPVKIIGVDDTGNPQPPTVVQSGAVIGSTSGWGIDLQGVAYCCNIEIVCDRSGSNFAAVLGIGNYTSAAGAAYWLIEDGILNQNSAHTGSAIYVGQVGASTARKSSALRLKNSVIRFANASQKIQLYGDFEWEGGSLNTTTAAPNVLVTFGVVGNVPTGSMQAEGIDLSGMGSGKALVDVSGNPQGRAVFANCKLGSAVSITSGTYTSPFGPKVEIKNCDSGDTNYRAGWYSPAGSIVTETVLVRTGGASDGVTPISWKLASNGDVEYPLVAVETTAISIWNADVGSSKTVAVEILHDSATNLTDGEIWLEVEYLGTSGFPLSSFVSDAKADVLATAADQTTSSETWTTTGMTNPNKQKLSVTFTPQEAGYFQVKVYLAKASKTVYVCPKLTVS